MPINDASVLFAADKTNINTTTTTTTKTPTTAAAAAAAASHTLKPGTHLELHLPNPGSTSSALSQTKLNDNALFKHQCQKWQQCIDFDRMLKQIRMCEKQHYLRAGGKDDASTVTSSGNGSAAATGGGGGSGNNSNGKNLPSPSSSSISPTKSSASSSSATTLSVATAATASLSPTAAAVSPSAENKCARKLRQVKPLNGNDMHYYGIVPKQAALGVIICNVCLRISTTAGFNNHMMVHHPTIWNNVSSKVIASTNSGDATTYNLHTHDSQDGIREVGTSSAGALGAPAPSDILGSPSDLSGTMSTCSNASSTSSMSSTYVTKHKSSKNGSIAGSSSSSSSGSGGRSRSKSKHHHSSSSTSSTSAEVSQTSSKSSKKSLSAVVSAAASSTASLHAVNSSKDNNATHGGSNSCSNSSSSSSAAKAIPDSMQSLAVYSSSSSSNSSCSLPPTPRMISVVSGSGSGSGGVDGSSTLLAPRDEAAYSPAALAALSESSTTKEKLSADVATQGATATGNTSTAKKKAHSPPFLGQGQEAVDSSSSSSEFDHSTSGGAASASKSSKHAGFATGAKVEKEIGHRSGGSMGATPLKKPPICEKDLKMYNTHISELDQAVSSITGCADSRLMSGSNMNENDSVSQTQMVESNASLGNKSQSLVPPSASITQIALGANTTTFPATTQAATLQACEEAIPHNSSDDNSILTLEDMLDSKFINDILNTADAEMHFDENELDSTTQQPYMSQHQQQQQQQPASKRMRYEDSIVLGQQQQHQTNDYALYQQQQQPQYVQMCKYDNNNTIDDVKLYNAEQQLPMDAQYQTQLSKLLQQQQQQDDTQHQITTIDAMQLQQLLYQQQNLGNYSGSLDQQQHAQQQQQQQYGDTNLLDAKQIIDFCADDGSLAKGANVGVYEQQPCHADAYANQFQVFNVPSLIDDDVDEDNTNGATSVDVLMPSMVDVLPSNEEQQHLIYEITANNQVAVLSQQRQQQMLAEFLTQANYENVTNVTSLPTTHDTTNSQQLQQQQQQTTQMHGAGIMTLEDDESSELLDFDFTHIETVRSLSTPTTTTATIDSKALKADGSNTSSNTSTNNSKYHDDYYLNVFIYAGIPKPLAINNFGLIKLPQAVATTFRKNLLTTRKANNSPISLNSSLNGLAGGGNATSVMRLTNVGVGSGSGGTVGKNPPSYFTSLSSGGSGGNEFSIGSITISNTPTLQQQQQQQQQNCSSSLEITLNANSNSPSTTATVAGTATTQHKGRAKNVGGINATLTATSSQSAASSGIGNASKGKTNTLGMATATMAGTGNMGTATAQSGMSRSMARQGMPVQQAKTIFVSSAAGGASNERVKCIKRSLIARMDSTRRSPSTLLAKHIAEILSSGGGGGSSSSSSTSIHKQQPLSTSTAVDGLAESEAVGCLEQQQQHQLPQLKQTRVKHFYEHRKRLYSLARQKQQQQQLLNKQLLLRTRPPSDCSSGSVSSAGSASSGSGGSNGNGFKMKSSANNNAINNNNSSSSNNNNNNNNNNSAPSSSNNNDIMRVFV